MTYKQICQIMSYGGDDRILLDTKKNLNKYNTAPFFTQNKILRSSCTSINPSLKSFLKAEALYEEFKDAAARGDEIIFFCEKFRAIRKELRKILAINGSEYFMILTPSGTDSEIYLTISALQKHVRMYKTWDDLPRVLNILTSEGEIGEASSLAAALKYPGKFTPIGTKEVCKGDTILGFDDNAIDVLTFRCRDICGLPVSKEKLESNIHEAIKKAIQKKQKIILHQVYFSKTGMKNPDSDFIEKMSNRYKDIDIVVDACQFRCSKEEIQVFLRKGYIVLLTGSKFMSGPPFSGLIIFPEKALSPAVLENHFLQHCSDYFTPYEFDDKLTSWRSQLNNNSNLGLLLRWTAAMVNIQSYYKIETNLIKHILQYWVCGIKNLINSSEYLQTFDLGTDPYEHGIVSFICVDPVLKQKLTIEKLRNLYQKLSLDECIIGQPVSVAQDYGVLRICMGASLILEIFDDYCLTDQSQKSLSRIIQDKLSEDKIIINKLDLILSKSI